MNFKILLLVLFGAVFCESLLQAREHAQRTKNFGDAISSLISRDLLRRHSNINFIKMDDVRVDEIVTKVLSENNGKFSYRTENYQSSSLTQLTGRKKIISIVLLDNIDSLMIFMESFREFKFESKGFYCLAILNGTTSDYSKVFQMFWAKKTFNVNVLHKQINSFELLTFKPFSDGNCEVLTTMMLNRFNSSLGDWITNIFYPQKFKNLYKCKLVHETTLDAVIASSTGNYRGKEIDIVNELARILNFTADNVISSTFGNGIKSGVMKNLVEEKIQMTAGSLQLSRTEVFSASSAFLSDPLVMIIPPASAFSSLEKFSRIFGKIVWLAILIVFIALMFLLAITHRKFTLRRSAGELLLNMVQAFLGGSLPARVLPKRNFGRLMLSTFMFYSLVLRTAYVGILFQYLRTEIKHKEIANVDEMIENDFTFYAFESMMDRIADFKFFKRFEELF